MKVIFLDIDGVLNSTHTFKNNTIYRLKYGDSLLNIDEKMVKRLSMIVFFTNAKIVLSSSWRSYFKKEDDKIIPINDDGEDLIEILNKYHLSLFDMTPYDEKRFRGKEIKSYLDLHPEALEFIVIDDEEFDLEEYKDNLVKTNFFGDENKTGLCNKHVYQAILKMFYFSLRNHKKGCDNNEQRNTRSY